MSNQYVGEIRLFGGSYAPMSWHLCDGSLLPIAQYDSLFALIGTTYGGDGVSTFALPDLRGRAPLHQGNGPGLTSRRIGESFGTETVTLSATQMPQHNHIWSASMNTPNQAVPSGGLFANTTLNYTTATPDTTAAAAMLGSVGGSQSHSNMMPTGCANYIIALEGIYPTRE